MAQPPLYPTIAPLLVDPAWFLVDKPVDLDKELKFQEERYQSQIAGIQQKGNDIHPIGKNASEPYSEDEEDDNDDYDDDDDNDDDEEEDDDSEMNDEFSDPMIH
ncbi:Anaphase-promoting complex subunit 15 [Chionoecetes opilio]|uniref:Anaphase-promoting complex subunit 15 n=1 Tax=Chionoecetes opilio TaxID=41210 RepID=A0A8J4YBB8_CHIOP|nr:Anaphase-promoting complex subunit 15 [Chionoecetes opilio]